MDKKEKTIRSYSMMADDLALGYDDYFNQIIKPEADRFLSSVSDGGKILDAGCGVGVHSLYFKDGGYRVVSIDLSPKMVEICQSKGLDAKLMDLENLQFPDDYFDGVWCHTSLIHLQTKELISPIMEKIAQIMKSGSPLFIALRLGEGEGWEKRHGREHSDRWFLYFSEGEFENYIPDKFNIMQINKTQYSNHCFINYHLLRQ